MEKTVLAIDPGTRKCGVALVRRGAGLDLHLLWRSVVDTSSLTFALTEAYAVEPYQLVIVGGGTHSHPVVSAVREELPSMGVLVVDEADTSLAARERYWEHHPRQGWKRFVPASLQVPPEPVDDFVAFILAERVLTGDTI